MTIATISIEELVIPATLGDPAAADFVEMTNVRNAIESEAIGSNALAVTATELLSVYRFRGHDPKRIFVARIDGRIVGRAILNWSIAPGSASSWITAEALPAMRGRGIGSALFDHVEGLARQSGRPIVQTDPVHTATVGGQRVPSPTGYGDVPAADPGVRFLIARGYRLEQVGLISFLDLPVDPDVLAAAERRAAHASGSDYEIAGWTGRTPARWILDMATLKTRMSTDQPRAGLEVDEEPWDEARMIVRDDAIEAGGRTILTAAALHTASGNLCGFSELTIPREGGGTVRQEDTLVLAEHRGHRLGMLLKIANLQRLASVSPRSRMVYTFNAAENRHMLAVNEALGFRSVGLEGAWRNRD